ncbi:hypothetical protein TTHERM_00438850 (macronuclear) [Tetrahymena thermophila SB210]|uniref:Essential protein Yae1 N-terminal domain-containing protein n=1 Tax=Tetrahymena thermophila (strain SB210) TaxID=312017 RepID=I7MK51_TETTS|nr:hypothetical protein TTHERM_00438850 [Tetrahymena thermophila SB210]EAR97537.2 hypothetical protein TTHERM_00438850 [Tetrahymena thermophila SB210]|eukprot:XP_001017782.2 hypothetical protein TTHERM_00438850 [Tetrahymena thermophila SB210]
MEQEEDPFEAINHIQNQYYVQGYQKAKNDKELEQAAEKKQYYDQGFITGKQLGLELGYYCGYIEDLKQVLPILEEYKKHQQKVDKLIEEIEQIILSIDPEQGNVDLDELPNTILVLRNKFKILLLSLGFKKPDFNFSDQQNTNQVVQNDNFSF